MPAVPAPITATSTRRSLMVFLLAGCRQHRATPLTQKAEMPLFGPIGVNLMVL
jgi:hypothetical protein